MPTATSKDGTRIAYDRIGEGPPLVVVNGALADRRAGRSLAAALALRLTTFVYDRRGRGDSGDTPPYAVEREIEDLAAVVAEAGVEASIFGHSSGAALALEAVLRGLRVTRLVLYEPPYIVDDSRPPVPDDYLPTLRNLVAEGRRAAAVEYFWRVGLLLPEDAIARLHESPAFPGFEAIAHTIAYDGEVMDGHMVCQPLPADWARVTIPTLVIDGGESPPQLRNSVAAVAELLPNARRVTLEGQGHSASTEVLAPVLESFLLG